MGSFSHYINLSCFSLLTLNCLADLHLCLQLHFELSKALMLISDEEFCSHPNSEASKLILALIYKRNYEISLEMSDT